MPTDETKPAQASRSASDAAHHEPGRSLTPAAERALAEAAARRAERERQDRERQDRERQVQAPPKEIAGRGGLDPTRYGDWEVNGLASDF